MKRKVEFRCMFQAPDMGDHDLDGLTNLIRRPIIGLFYRHRFRMVLNLCPMPADRVLEIGYGTGFLAYTLAPLVREYFAVDIHTRPKLVEKTLQDLGISNVSCGIGDARNLEGVPDGFFDLVASVSCLEHIREQDAVQRQVWRVLKDGGTAVYGLPTKNLFASLCLRIVGYDDRIIHPSSPSDVIAAAGKAGFTRDREEIFPTGLGKRFGLYWVGRFLKNSSQFLCSTR